MGAETYSTVLGGEVYCFAWEIPACEFDAMGAQRKNGHPSWNIETEICMRAALEQNSGAVSLSSADRPHKNSMIARPRGNC